MLYFSCLLLSHVMWLLSLCTLPHGAVGGSAVHDCGISWSYSLTFFIANNQIRQHYNMMQYARLIITAKSDDTAV